MLTYLNKQGNPMVRQCENCQHFNPIPASDRTGYCKKMQMIFAYTGTKTVYGMTRSFYVCENNHEFTNEDILKQSSRVVEMQFKSKPNSKGLNGT